VSLPLNTRASHEARRVFRFGNFRIPLDIVPSNVTGPPDRLVIIMRNGIWGAGIGTSRCYALSSPTRVVLSSLTRVEAAFDRPHLRSDLFYRLDAL